MMSNTAVAEAAHSAPMPTLPPAEVVEILNYKTLYDDGAIARIRVGDDARPVELKLRDMSVPCLRIRRNVPGGYIPCFISGPNLEECNGMIRGAFAVIEAETDRGKTLIVTFDMRPEEKLTHRISFVNRDLLDVVDGEKYHRFLTPDPMKGVVLVIEGAEAKVRMKDDATFQLNGRNNGTQPPAPTLPAKEKREAKPKRDKQPKGQPESKPMVYAVGTDKDLEALFAEGFTVYSAHSRSLVLTKGKGSNMVTKPYRMKVGYTLDPSRMPPPPPEQKKAED